MKQERSAAAFLPETATLPRLKEAAAVCRGCDLYKRATQTVFGEGSEKADIVFVGEQPGDQEDRAGHPFVGPAGQILDKALEAAGLHRDRAYVTNAVKHFKWLPLGKRRIHKKPFMSEIQACRPWLDAELDAIRPRVVVCLGSTAAQAVLERMVRIQQERGTFQEAPRGVTAFVTVHPSSILRAPEPEQRDEEYARFVKELALVRAWTREHERPTRRARHTEAQIGLPLDGDAL